MALKDLPCIGCDTQEGCGTGLGNWPKPGDPDNNSVLTATPAYGGIDVEWSYPTTNPFAVQHTLLFRGLSPDFNGAALHSIVAGNYFHDQITESTVKYYYWIQIVSVNGTYNDPIGPASATAMPLIEEMMRLLTGKIDSGVLAQSLKTDIARIGSVDDNLQQEIIDRKSANQKLADAFALVENKVVDAIAYIDNEVQARTQGYNALVQEINTLAVANQDAMAAVRAEAAARVSDIAALATQITTVQSSLKGDISSVQVSLQTNVNNINNTIKNIGALYTAKVTVNGLVGGFGVFNDGTTVEAGFDVDRFWVGRTNGNKIKPFIIENDVVYINEAAINKLTFDKLRDSTGNVVVQNGKLKAQYLDVTNLSALSSNMGTITAGVMKSADGKFVIDLNNKTISITV